MLLSESQLKDLLVNPKNGPRNHFIATCPWCEKEGHFYINKGSSVKRNIVIDHGYDCKKCNVNGAIYTFLAKIDKLFLLKGKQVEFDTLTKLEFDIIEGIADIDMVVPDIKLPIGSKPILRNSPQYNYLLKRNFTETDFDIYQPHYTKTISKFIEYVIMPVYQDYSIKGYVARCVIEDNELLRYQNSKHTNFGKLIFGLDEVNHKTHTAILVEGIFDKTNTTNKLELHNIDEVKCLCTFGKKISDYQIWLLKKIGIKNIILMYDERDAVNDMKVISFELSNDFNVLIASTGKNDPGASTQEDFLFMLDNLKSPEAFWLDKIQKKKFK